MLALSEEISNKRADLKLNLDDMKEDSSMEKCMEMENSIGMMEKCIKDSSLMEIFMEKD